MPDNIRPPRHLPDDDQSNLGTRALMNAIADLAKAKKLSGARIAYKRNAKGEHVVASSSPGSSASSPAGVAWAHRDGDGFDIVLEALPVSGRVALRRNKPRAARA